MTPRTYYAMMQGGEILKLPGSVVPALCPVYYPNEPSLFGNSIIPVHLVPAAEYAALTALRDAASDVVDDCYEYDLNPKEWLLVVAGRIDALKAALEAVDGATQTNQNGETK